eukprot:6187701-Pleurochrysis_carterae.AAC.3
MSVAYTMSASFHWKAQVQVCSAKQQKPLMFGKIQAVVPVSHYGAQTGRRLLSYSLQIINRMFASLRARLSNKHSDSN